MKTTRKMLAMLLCLCLLAGCLAALAEDTDYVTVTEGEEGGHADVTVNLGEVNTRDLGISLNERRDVTGNIEPIPVKLSAGGKDGLDEEFKNELSPSGTVPPTIDTLTINADSVTSEDTGINERAYDFTGDVNITVTNAVEVSGTYSAEGIYVDTDEHAGAVDIRTGDVLVSANNDDGVASAYGVEMQYGRNNQTDIHVGNVTATATSTREYGWAEATGIRGSADKGYEGQNADGTTDIVAVGDVEAKATGANGTATGVEADAQNGGALTIAVLADAETGEGGNITATGENSVGVALDANPNPQSETQSTVDVIAEGTVSGGTRAIQFAGVYDQDKNTYDLGGASLVLWAATPDENGSVAQIRDYYNGYTISDKGVVENGPEYDEGDEVFPRVENVANVAASDVVVPDEKKVTDEQKKAVNEALKNAIHYIIKIAEGETALTSAVGENGTTHAGVAEGVTYQTAIADEWVKLGFKLADNEGLDGVFYHEDDKNALTTADADRLKQENGSFWVKMLSGGGMLLKLQTHKHDFSVLKEHVKAPTCTEAGVDLYKCSKCDRTVEKAVPALGHDYEAVVTKPTCTEKGYTKHTCSRCGDSYTDSETAATGHDWDAPTYTWSADNKTVTAKRVCKNDPSHVEQETVNVTATVTKQPTEEAKGETTYAAVFTNPAFAAQSKTLADIDKLASGKKKATKNLVYTERDEWRGLKSADRTQMGEALKKIARSIESQNGGGEGGLTVRMWYLDEGVLVPEELLAAFDALSLEDRLLILMDLLECGEPEGLSEDGQAVLDDIHAAIEAMTPEQQAARKADMDKHFLPRTVIDESGVEHPSVCIELEIAEGEKLSYERYTFFEDEGVWKLFKIETGEYR